MNKLEIGSQYNNDNSFKAAARLLQSEFRASVLKLKDYSEYGNRLCESDARKGLNFYDDYNMFSLVKGAAKYSSRLYSDMLRSEHIPWNMFIPFREEQELFIRVFNDLLKMDIASVDSIQIEYAPQPKENYLNDATAFDVFIELKLKSEDKVFLGIEIKYTEGAYPLIKGYKQEKTVNDLDSIYYRVTKESDSIQKEYISLLKQDDYRQI